MNKYPSLRRLLFKSIMEETILSDEFIHLKKDIRDQLIIIREDILLINAITDHTIANVLETVFENLPKVGQPKFKYFSVSFLLR